MYKRQVLVIELYVYVISFLSNDSVNDNAINFYERIDRLRLTFMPAASGNYVNSAKADAGALISS